MTKMRRIDADLVKWMMQEWMDDCKKRGEDEKADILRQCINIIEDTPTIESGLWRLPRSGLCLRPTLSSGRSILFGPRTLLCSARRKEVGNVQIQCSNCGATRKFSYCTGNILYTVVACGWNSYGRALYCRKCSEIWRKYNGPYRFLSGRKNTIALINAIHQRESELAHE